VLSLSSFLALLLSLSVPLCSLSYLEEDVKVNINRFIMRNEEVLTWEEDVRSVCVVSTNDRSDAMSTFEAASI
jgi:hypothetical protein